MTSSFDEASATQCLYVIVSLKHRRRGLGEIAITEAMKTLSHSGAHRVVANIHKSNAALIGLFKKLGFQLSSEKSVADDFAIYEKLVPTDDH